MTVRCARPRRRFRLALLLVFLAAAVQVRPVAGSTGSGKVRIVYIEASTGRRWQLEDLPRRLGDERFQVQFLPEYAFDKSAQVAAALAAPAGPPAAIVLQECSVYFPGPLAEYQRLFHRWVQDIRAAGVTPIVATVIPPARHRSWVQELKEFVKVTFLGREKQHEQVLAFNAWLRRLAQDEKLLLLDLELALRSSSSDAHLNSEFDVGDGIHVNAAAYAVLDRLLGQTLSPLLAAP